MSKYKKTLLKILGGTSDTNIEFSELCQILEKLGFDVRIRGSHHIYTKKEVVEILNIQSKHGKAKPYQVKQVRRLIVEYGLIGDLL